MRRDLQRRSALNAEPSGRGPVAPGRTTKSQDLRRGRPTEATQRSAAAPAPAQATEHAAGASVAPVEDAFSVHQLAEDGLRGAAGELPHRAAIQASFGRHDVSGIRAHVGGPAAQAAGQMGAHAYASGDAVAFAEAPDVHLAAHEAAHVVQQRGGVQLAGGVGQVGDPYEQHADAVADLVASGRSAEALLDATPGAAGARGPVSAESATGSTSAASTASAAPALQQRRRTYYWTDPVPGPDGTATETIDRAGLATATVAELCTAYAMNAPADPAAPVTIGGAQVSYEWIHGRVGTVVLRGEVRSRMLADGADACDRHAATIAAITGEASRIAELQAMVTEVRTGRRALLDEHRGVSTFATRVGTSAATEEDRAAVAGREHRASDITARAGTGVYAPLLGEVIFSGGHPGYGNVVRLLHREPPRTREAPPGPIESVYAHLSARLVAVGDTVQPGQAIGMVGRTTGDEDPDGDGEGSSGTVRPRTSPGAAHLHMAVIPRAGTDLDVHESHSTARENRAGNHVHPDRWLAQLGVSISAERVFRMTDEEAAAAQAAAVASGGSREVRHETRDDGRGEGPAVSPFSTGTPTVAGGAALEVAARGLEGASAPLPFARELQQSFGGHSLAGVTAQIGGPAAESAAALGASAYASGERVAFREAPSLQLAAHEAAHVVQQRRGEVPGGLGARGDAAERHADLVADAVVRGESAAALLEEGPGSRGGASGPAVQRDEDPVYGTDSAVTLPAGVTQADVTAAIAFNNALELRIDWVRRLQSHLRADGARTSLDGTFDTDTIAGVMRLQSAASITPVDGHITPHLRRLLERMYPDLRSTLLGTHLETGRVLVPGAAGPEERYRYYRDLITGAAGVFLDQPREINLLAIRGVTATGAPPNLELQQSGSAAEFAAARAEDDAALADGSAEGDHLHSDDAHPPTHFSGARRGGAPGAGFDDVVISLWYELVEGERRYHVTEHRGSVDPASVWSDSEANDHPETEGTSHLRDGQYLYHLGEHRTESPTHRAAVVGAYGGRRGPVRVRDGADSTRYSALVASRDIEVWRDGPGAEDDHYLTAAEEEASNRHVTDHDPRYVHAEDIAINIHSSPARGPSSLGCQTVPTTEGYSDLIGEVRGSANSDRVYYTVLDASRIEHGLVLVSSEAR